MLVHDIYINVLIRSLINYEQAAIVLGRNTGKTSDNPRHHMTVAMCLFTIQEKKEKEKENKRKREIKLEKIDKKKKNTIYTI